METTNGVKLAQAFGRIRSLVQHFRVMDLEISPNGVVVYVEAFAFGVGGYYDIHLAKDQTGIMYFLRPSSGDCIPHESVVVDGPFNAPVLTSGRLNPEFEVLLEACGYDLSAMGER